MGRQGEGEPGRASPLLPISPSLPMAEGGLEPPTQTPGTTKNLAQGDAECDAISTDRVSLDPDLAALNAAWPKIEGLLSPVDAPMLALFCNSYEIFRNAQKEITERGLLVKGPRGNQSMNPACRVAKSSMETMIRIGARFGVTPADRTGLRSSTTKTDGVLAKYLV